MSVRVFLGYPPASKRTWIENHSGNDARDPETPSEIEGSTIKFKHQFPIHAESTQLITDAEVEVQIGSFTKKASD